MSVRYINERPCVLFAQWDMGDPEVVAVFMHWLLHGCLPRAAGDVLLPVEEDFAAHRAMVEATPWMQVEEQWDMQAPRRRMLRLLWEHLTGRDDFYSEFHAELPEMKKDASRAADVLLEIQKRLRQVLEGLEVVERDALDAGQAAWGEAAYLPPDQADLVREQLGRARPDLLQKRSDIIDATRAWLNSGVKQLGLLRVPVDHPDREYVGEVHETRDGMARVVFVEAPGRRMALQNAKDPYTPTASGDFSWGYAGGGPNALSLSVLADATGGLLDLAYEHQMTFRDEVLTKWESCDGFQISRAEVLEWLRSRNVDEGLLAERLGELEPRRLEWERQVARAERVLSKNLVAQRFDLVPQDFEAALYVDLMEMVREGVRILKCAHCKLPIACDESARSNRQRARWRKGQPVYHEGCFGAARALKNREGWRRWASAPDVQERRRQKAREARQRKKEGTA